MGIEKVSVKAHVGKFFHRSDGITFQLEHQASDFLKAIILNRVTRAIRAKNNLFESRYLFTDFSPKTFSVKTRDSLARMTRMDTDNGIFSLPKVPAMEKRPALSSSLGDPAWTGTDFRRGFHLFSSWPIFSLTHDRTSCALSIPDCLDSLSIILTSRGSRRN